MDVEDLVKSYFRLGFSNKEILCLLAHQHGVIISKSIISKNRTESIAHNLGVVWFLSLRCHLQFFSIVYTQILVLETQWPQHVTHSPTPWTNSAKLQAQFLLYIQIAVLKHTFFKTLHTIFMQKISCFHKEHTAIQICTLTHHKGKHPSHSFTISNQSFSIKGQQVSFSVLEQWMPTLEIEAEPEEWE